MVLLVIFQNFKNCCIYLLQVVKLFFMTNCQTHFICFSKISEFVKHCEQYRKKCFVPRCFVLLVINLLNSLITTHCKFFHSISTISQYGLRNFVLNYKQKVDFYFHNQIRLFNSGIVLFLNGNFYVFKIKLLRKFPITFCNYNWIFIHMI